ncbi:MAG TPA: DNA-3-methyladenine glycosylase [Candidatus Saccharimonadia bacterium]
MPSDSDSFNWLPPDSLAATQRLLGCELERELGGQVLRVRIVETEAYDQSDPASHSFRGHTPRTSVMFGPAGHLYVYFTYGMHYCCNIVVGPAGHGAAVLLRAAEPLEGELTMAGLRPGARGVNLTNGPAKLCQALAITRELNGQDLAVPPLRLIQRPALEPAAITQTTRIGIKHATDRPWRLYITDNPYISRR